MQTNLIDAELQQPKNENAKQESYRNKPRMTPAKKKILEYLASPLNPKHWGTLKTMARKSELTIQGAQRLMERLIAEDYVYMNKNRYVMHEDVVMKFNPKNKPFEKQQPPKLSPLQQTILGWAKQRVAIEKRNPNYALINTVKENLLKAGEPVDKETKIKCLLYAVHIIREQLKQL